MLGYLFASVQAQENYSIHLQTEALSEGAVQQLSEQAKKQAIWQEQAFEGNVYFVIQFETLPTQAERAALLLQGVVLLDYLPRYAYLARAPQWIPASHYTARAVFPLPSLYKLSRKLAGELEAAPTGSIKLRVLPMPGIAPQKLAEVLLEAGFPVENADAFSVLLDTRKEDIGRLAALPALYFLETAPPEPSPEGEQANALMRSNWASQSPGSNYDGSGVTIGIADDGTVSHADKKGRVINMSSYNWGTHGDMTTGIAIGCGNIDPRAAGLAPAATVQLSLISGYPHIQNAVQYYQQYQTITTSTSYGESCGGYYNSGAQFIDEQVFSHPYLMHHFSAGNSSSSSCSSVYGSIVGPDGRHFGNITGGYKAGKNAITVGNATFGDILSPSSSRGPLEDGRLKPDLCAIGQGSLTTDDNDLYRLGSGTSAASPAIAGIYAVLAQAYRNLHNNQDPPSALLKAAMLNTAEDLGRPGPDYEYGWGRVSGHRALSIVEQQQYQTAQIGQDAMQSHAIYVPAGAKELRVMLYWHDPAGSPLAAQALVNDLDLSLQGPNNAIYLPYRLSTFPHIDSLTQPAYAGIDRINNAEQVVLKNPAQGNYNARAFGYMIPEGPQPYFIVYSIIQEELSIVYPHGGESLVPGETVNIFWEATGSQGTFTLEYSLNGGASWNTVASNIDGSLRYYSWPVPAAATGTARVRVRRNGYTATGSNFSILNIPDFHITSAGPATARLFWEPVAGASQYDVYALGSKFMQVISSTGSTSIDIPVSPSQGNWYSVRARQGNTVTGRRAYAKYYEHHPCEEEITLTLMLDGNPGQVQWRIMDQSNGLLANGGPYSAAMANKLITIPLCLPQGCHIFTIEDSGADGLCCSAGQGYYQLRNAQGQVLTSGSGFGASSTANFCLLAGQPPLQATIDASPSTSCYDSSDGWATVSASGGTPPYTYQWSNGSTAQQANGLAGGLYTVTVSDGTSAVVASVSIGQPAPMSLGIQAQAASCGNTPGGFASAGISGGSPPYSYLWSNGATTPAISGLTAGYYQLTVTDSHGCAETAYALVQAPPPLSIVLNPIAPSCADAQNGQLFSSVSGGSGSYTYQWSNGNSSAILQNIGAGYYQLTVTDSEGCTKTSGVTLQAPAPLMLLPTIGQDGQSASLSASGGTPPYQFQWPDGSTSSSAAGLEPGDHEVSVTDSHGCMATTTVSIETPLSGPCFSEGTNATYNWIESIELGNIQNTSGNNGGYASFAGTPSLQPELVAGESLDLVLAPGFYSNAFLVNWAVWIDLNEDGDYADAGEQVLPVQSGNGTVYATLSIPPDVSPGLKPLRISMAFGIVPEPCEGFVYGEVEDYAIRITAGSVVYCTSAGQNTAYEWIERVSFDNFSNGSGDDGGYGDYSGFIVPALAGASVPFTLEPGYSASAFPESWSIWIDYNQDGQFETNQELAFSIAPAPNTINGQFTVPAWLAEGTYRMRIVMRWGTALNACETYNWGETEDYTLQAVTPLHQLAIQPEENARAGKDARSSRPAAGEGLPGAALFPNPAGLQARLRLYMQEPGALSLELADALGQRIEKREVFAEAGWTETIFDTSRLPEGLYFMVIETPQGRWVKGLAVAR
ncbi:MAG: S8 family serine peptidase [Phaeodactylibacter sp.]|nr:S8 family serine peptidase [Phaeodactylibacter sp.]MCB9276410.1 S8 family serine peptidase [Lewinellaceae bacterium]